MAKPTTRHRLPTVPPKPRIKACCVLRNMTQRRLGIAARISETRLSDIVRGRAVATNAEMRRIARALDATVEDLFVLTDADVVH